MPDADLILSDGAVFAPDAARPASAVAVRAGRIVAVGGDEVLELRGSRTEIVDLRGRMLLPGFQDAHVHPVWAGLDRLRCDLSALHGRPRYLAAIAEYARSHPDASWVLGGGWSMSDFPGGTPGAADLDAVVADRPALLMNRDGHGAWVNSAALTLAGIDRDTADPADGRIERDRDGTPTGTLHEGAMRLVTRHIPDDPLETMVEALLLAQSRLHAYGVTSWQDAAVGRYGDAGDPGPAYVAAAETGRLTARVVGALWFERGRGAEQIPELLEKRERYRAGRFAATRVKIMQDGVAENFTAAMLEPYLAPAGSASVGSASAESAVAPEPGTGISFFPPEVLAEVVPALDAAGFGVHFHAIGDRAVRESLDAIEVARRRNGPSDRRHHIAHLQVVHPDDLPRFRRLGVAATIQALWACYDEQMIELTLPFLGPERSARQYPFADLHRSGALLAAGSDWSVSTPDPLAGIHVAVTRRPAPGEPDAGVAEPFLPEQRLSLATALRAYTAGSAWVNGLDADAGTIAPGKLADLVVLDRDPLAGPAEEIGRTRVLQTFVEGERVFAADDAD